MDGPAQRFIIVDLRIPFFRLVFFFVKAALAVVPAAIILAAIAFLLSALFVGGSEIYDAEVDRTITRLTSLLEPFMILLMGSVVFFIVLAILLPIFEMSQIVK